MKKVKAAILCDNVGDIKKVYADRLDEIAELCDFNRQVITSDMLEKTDLREVELLFSTWGMPALTPEQLDKMPNLKVLFYAAGATDSFCRPLLARGIQVVSAWQANGLPVAEYTVSAIILGLKNFFQLVRTGHSPQDWKTRYRGRGAYGATVTLLGSTGAVATHVARLLGNFNLKVIGIPSPVAERTVSFEEAFPVSQVVSNHLPDRDDNVGCINGALLESMPYGGVFINTGRGRQVNEAEMIAVLKHRPDLTALLDVQYPEPPEAESELYTLPNVFLTPHIAGSLGDEWPRMADYMIAELKRYLNGEPLLYAVKESMLLTSK